MTYSYLILDRKNNVVKIGKSDKPLLRLSQLQTSNPTRLELIASFEELKYNEAYLHKLFKEYRKRGEWFIYSDKIIEFIKSNNEFIKFTGIIQEKPSKDCILMSGKFIELVLDDSDVPLWQKIFYFILLEVVVDDGTVDCEINSKMAEYFNVSLKNLDRARKKLIDKNWIIKYPYGTIRAKKYMINPLRHWSGTEASRQLRIKEIYEYEKATDNKIIDVTTSNYKDLAA